MPKHSNFTLVATLAVVPALAACSGNPLPGTMLGTYEVVAESQTNTCGLEAPNPWTFDVQLSEDGTTLYWSFMDGTPPLFSPLTGQSATLTATIQNNVDGTADGGLGPCTMERDDSLPITLGSGSPPPAFTGSIHYNFSVPAGAVCTDQLTASGGQYETLPCSITYSMTASRQ
jgi:hypothetical protein